MSHSFSGTYLQYSPMVGFPTLLAKNGGSAAWRKIFTNGIFRNLEVFALKI